MLQGLAVAGDTLYWLAFDGGFVSFAAPGTIAGDTQPGNETLVGVTGAADRAIYRLPQERPSWGGGPAAWRPVERGYRPDLAGADDDRARRARRA